jgi:predicted SAM-dependent methyltransferase
MARRLGPNTPLGIRKAHVGCGPHAILPDWWNVDIRSFLGIDEVIDATEPWPYVNLDYVFAEHFIEHLPLDRALQFLIHAENSLRIGGIIRLSTPNLEWVLHTHSQTGDADIGKRLMDTLRTNRAFHGWGHHFLYSAEMLLHLLEQLGYIDICLCDYGESTHPELANPEKHGNFSINGGFASVISRGLARAGTACSTANPDRLPARKLSAVCRIRALSGISQHNAPRLQGASAAQGVPQARQPCDHGESRATHLRAMAFSARSHPGPAKRRFPGKHSTDCSGQDSFPWTSRN